MVSEQEVRERSNPHYHWKTRKRKECFNVTVLSVVKNYSVLKKFVAEKSYRNRTLIGDGQSKGLCASLVTADFMLD